VVPAFSSDRFSNAWQDGRPPQACTGAPSAFIAERIRQTPHLTLHGLKDELAARGVTVSHNAVWVILRREGLRFKKMLFALE
jgi:transposase